MSLGGGAGTLGSEAGTLGSDALSPEIDDGVIIATFGGGTGMPGCMEFKTEGVGSAAGPLKIARRLSMARNWAWWLSGIQSACTALVRAWFQWMILSVVVSIIIERVRC